MTLVDKFGAPLMPSGNREVDAVNEVVAFFDQDPSKWEKLETAFDEQLQIARGHAGGIVQVANDTMNLDVSNPAGLALARLLADITFKALVLKARNDRDEDAKIIPMPKREDAPDVPAT